MCRWTTRFRLPDYSPNALRICAPVRRWRGPPSSSHMRALSGAVVRLAAQQGMAAPLNARMCELLDGPRQRFTGKQMRQMLGL